MRLGMVIDLKRCIGCQACTVACKQKNATPPGTTWSRVIVTEVGSFPNAKLSFLPVLCNHCDDPPCEEVCPTGATAKQPDGTVSVDPDKCIGCRYCMVACPYNARFFNYGEPATQYDGKAATPFEVASVAEHRVGKVGKCNFCADRVSDGKAPKCVETCPSVARFFGDLDDPNSVVAKLAATPGAFRIEEGLGTKPSVWYLPG